MIKTFRLKPFMVIMALLLAACAPAPTPTEAVTSAPAATSAPAPTAEAVTEVPTVIPTAIANTPSIGDQLAQIDDILKQSISASIAYNKPQSMLLDETTTIELLLNPSLSPEALGTQVTASGQVTSASVQITPRMKAYLIADDDSAFTIQPVHDNPEQLVSGKETTRWAWLVTARKSGLQGLTLILYRLVQYGGQDYWREIESYQANIEVQVTISQRIDSLDWKWIIGILITALLIPAFWRWTDHLKKLKSKLNQKKPDAKKKAAPRE
jgi:hypothetical protein